MGIERLIFKATGIMSKGCIVKNCEKIGNAVSEEMARNSGHIEIEKIHEILCNTVGKKAASKIKITADKDSFLEVARNKIGIPEEQAESIWNSSSSSAIPIEGKNSLVSLRIDRMAPSTKANISVHELEHAMNQTCSFESLFTRLFNKTKYGKSQIAKMMEQVPMLNQKGFETQSNLIFTIGRFGISCKGLSEVEKGLTGLLKQTKFTSRTELREAIRGMLYSNGILSPETMAKDNKLILKFIKTLLKDESRAYSVGGKSENLWYKLSKTPTNGNATKSELCSDLYDEAVSVINEELKHIRHGKVKKLLGKKVSNERELGIIQQYKAQLEKTKKVMIENCKEEKVLLSDKVSNLFA